MKAGRKQGLKGAPLAALLTAATLVQTGTLTAYGHAGHEATKDYSGHWSEPLVAAGISGGLLEGYEDGSFRPDSAITRAELAVLLARAYPQAEGQTQLPAEIADASREAWYGEAAARAVAAGYLSLDGDGLFQPGQGVNRIELATVLASLLHWEEQAAAEEAKDGIFIPEGEAGSWLRQAASGGYLQPSDEGYILPYRAVTRSEALYALARARGVVPSALLPSGVAAVQELEGSLRETDTGFAIRVTSGHGSYTDYALGAGGASLAGTEAASGIDGAAVRVSGISGLVPGALQVLELAPALAQAGHGQLVKLEGILLEGHHSGTADPKKHTLKCLLMPGCAKSGFGISVLQDDGSYKYYKFDTTGHQLAAVLLDSITRQNDIVIHVEGALEEDTLYVARLYQELDAAAAAGDQDEEHGGHDVDGEDAHSHSGGETSHSDHEGGHEHSEDGDEAGHHHEEHT